MVVEEGDGDLAVGLGQPRVTEGSKAPDILAFETPKTQSVSVQKAGDDAKVKSPGTDVAELFASSSLLAYTRWQFWLVKRLSRPPAAGNARTTNP